MIKGIPDGWELVRVGRIDFGEYFVNSSGVATQWDATRSTCENFLIIRKKPKQYRPFANAAEYVANRREGFAVDWNFKDSSPGFYAVVGANNSFLFVAVGEVIARFDWSQAFEKLVFRHTDNTTSPFGVEVQS